MDLSVAALTRAYRSGALLPEDVVAEAYRRIASRGRDFVWTRLVPQPEAMARARALRHVPPASLPLYGIPFGVKDNIHVAGLPTSAACAAFDRPATQTATCVTRLIDAGAILIGKQNMDQFATGLVGIRSPEGFCRNPFDERYIPGGSSSGSAVAVAIGEVSFSLGSDTGGSGRVPAALNNIVGLKPTPGAVSTAGMLYCNRSFDCVPIFALTCEDAWSVFRELRGRDGRDPYSRDDLPVEEPAESLTPFRFGTPRGTDLDFFGDALARRQFDQALALLQRIGGRATDIDYAPFREAGDCVFGGALLAERLVDYGPALDECPEAIHPAVRTTIETARRYSAVDAFKEMYRLQELRRRAEAAFASLGEHGVLVVPTAGTVYRCADVLADPIALNRNMGRYTYFVNPLGLCALAVPAGLRPDGLPFGVSLIAPPGADARLQAIGRAFARLLELPPGVPRPAVAVSAP